MKQYKITSADFKPVDTSIPDAYIDPEELRQVMLGDNYRKPLPEIKSSNLGKIQQEQNIKPGTEEWFKLWFGNK